MKKLLMLFACVLALASCTKNQRAKQFGGEAKLEVPCNQKVTNITWKNDQLWYSTIPMDSNDIPQIHTFREESSFGIMEGTYSLFESKCN
jgi:hypothetical protein